MQKQTKSVIVVANIYILNGQRSEALSCSGSFFVVYQAAGWLAHL